MYLAWQPPQIGFVESQKEDYTTTSNAGPIVSGISPLCRAWLAASWAPIAETEFGIGND
jgi:hypothetical protein